MYQAMQFLKNVPGGRQVKVFSDSAYALCAPSGLWRPEVNLELARLVRNSFRDACSLHELTPHHVYPHADWLWNDRADQMADEGHDRRSLIAV